MHCPKNYINLRIKVRAFYSWNRCNEICLVSEPDRCAKKADLPVCNAYYAICMFMYRTVYCICIPLHLIQQRQARFLYEDSDYAWDSVIQIMLGTV